jgi:NADP-dependent 3-hydroxy acid dehydrogenase YdfG
MSTIEGKVVAITGASSGIGEAAARLLAERGAKVVVGARRSERLEKLVAAIQAKNGEARFRTLDVTSREDMKAFMDFGKAGFGRVDVLVNNAGIMPLSASIIEGEFVKAAPYSITSSARNNIACPLVRKRVDHELQALDR